MKERVEVILWGKAGMWHAGCKALNINCIKKFMHISMVLGM